MRILYYTTAIISNLLLLILGVASIWYSFVISDWCSGFWSSKLLNVFSILDKYPIDVWCVYTSMAGCILLALVGVNVYLLCHFRLSEKDDYPLYNSETDTNK